MSTRLADHRDAVATPPATHGSVCSDGDQGVAQLLREVLAELRGIRLALARENFPDAVAGKLSRADRDRLAAILPAVAGAFGSELFTSADVLESSSAGVRLVTEYLNTRQLGRLLRRASGVPVGGFLVDRAGEELHRTLWRIVATT